MSTQLIDSFKTQERATLIERLKSGELQRVYKKYNMERVYLFGSYLTGEQRSDSDVDLLVTFTGENEKDIQFAKKILSISSDARQEIEDKIHHKIDFVPEMFLKNSIRSQIDKTTLLPLR